MGRVALLLVVCAAVPAVAFAARDPHAEKRHHTRADMALARRVLLRQADVGPDWRRTALPQDTSTLHCAGFDPDFSRFTITGESQALYSFGSADQIVSSSQVYRTRAQAVGDFELGARPELAACLRTTLLRSLRGSGAPLKVQHLSARAVRAPRIGQRAAAYRLTATLAANGLRIRVFLDLLAFQRGRTQAALVFTGVGAPVPSQTSYARAVDARMR